MAITDGLYELRSVMLTSMCVDVAGASAVKGANVLLYATNDGNNQKFVITEEATNSWSIQSASSGLYVDVNGGAAANGTNVQQWTANGSRAQRWKITDTGTTATINGVTCQIVTIGSYVTPDGATYMMDVDHAMTSNSTNVLIWTSNGGDNQKFALLPTTLYDATMPAPVIGGWASAVGDSDAQTTLPTAATLYPMWYFTDSWDALNDYGFEYSYRSRLIENGTADAGTWGAWSAWTSATVTTSGNAAWLTAGLSATFDTTTYKALEYGFKVRATGTINGDTYHSPAATIVLRAVMTPTITVTGVDLGPRGLVIGLSTDYDGGTNFVTVTSITSALGAQYVGDTDTISGFGTTFQGVIPYGSLTDVPAYGTAVDVAYSVGTDQYPATGVQTTSSVTVGYASGKTLTPTLSEVTNDASRIVTTTVTQGDRRAAWLFVNGEAFEVKPRVTGGTVFDIPAPFGVAYTELITVEKADGTAWGLSLNSVAADYYGFKRCHAWSWTGGSFVLDVLDGFMQTTRTVKADYSDFQLNNRPWHSLKFAGTLDGQFDAQGVLKDGLTAYNKAQLMALMKQHTVTYRAPSGEVATVGITDVNYSTIRSRTSVSVSMTQAAQ